MDPEKNPPEPDYEVEVIKDKAPKRDDETENIGKEGDPFGDNFA